MMEFAKMFEVSVKDSPLYKLMEAKGDLKIDLDTLDKPIVKEIEANKALGCPIEGHGGHWDGERGNSMWIPDDDYVPKGQHTNPEGKTWKEIKEEYGFEGIPFKDGEPDFSEIAEATVEIDDFSCDRDDNFKAADEKLAEAQGVSPNEIKQKRQDEGLTWHECRDQKTMQLVPEDVHGNVSHNGGVAEAKREVGA